MGNRYESLPKGVQKLVKKLADVEREQLSVLRAHHPDEEADKQKDCRDLLKAVGYTVLAAALIAAVVFGTQQLGIR